MLQTCQVLQHMRPACEALCVSLRIPAGGPQMEHFDTILKLE